MYLTKLPVITMGRAVPLYEKMQSDGPSVYYMDPSFRAVLEAHIPYFRTDNRATLIPIDEHTAYRFEFDLWGLLLDLSIPRYLHWLIMRLNGMTSPTEYGPDRLELLIPDLDVVDRLRTKHTTIQQVL